MLLYVHRDRRPIRDGKPRTATSTFTQLPNSDVYGYLKLSKYYKNAMDAAGMHGVVGAISELLLKSLNF